jgi:hypothetical protein
MASIPPAAQARRSTIGCSTSVGNTRDPSRIGVAPFGEDVRTIVAVAGATPQGHSGAGASNTISVPAARRHRELSTFLLIPMNEQGGFTTDALVPIVQQATASPFAFSDMFLFSHGWWTSADNAMVNYDQFNVGFTRCLISDAFAQPLAKPVQGQYFATGLHWPSVLTEDSTSVLNYAQALTYFTMRARADSVGRNGAYAILRRALAGGTVRHIYLIGHSFGCRAVCSAVQKLLANAPDILTGIDLRIVLLQPAFDQEDVEPDLAEFPGIPHRYSRVLSNPRIQVLMTKSQADLSLNAWYPMANLVGDVVNHPHGRLVGGAVECAGHLLTGAALAAGTVAGDVTAAIGRDIAAGIAGALQNLKKLSQHGQSGIPDQAQPAGPQPVQPSPDQPVQPSSAQPAQPSPAPPQPSPIDAALDANALATIAQNIQAHHTSSEAAAADIAMRIIHALGGSVALAAGGAGLRQQMIDWLTSQGWYTEVPVASNWSGPAKPIPSPKVIVADLTELQSGGMPITTDHHNDIYYNEIYRLIAWFLFTGRGA